MSVPGSVCSICFIFLFFFFFFLQFWFHWAGIQTFHLPVFRCSGGSTRTHFPLSFWDVWLREVFAFYSCLHSTCWLPVCPPGVTWGESPPTTSARHRQGRSCGKIPPGLPCSPCPRMSLRGFVSSSEGAPGSKGLIFQCKHTFPAGLEELEIKRRWFGHVAAWEVHLKKLGTEFFSHLCKNLLISMETHPKFTTAEVKRDWAVLFQTSSQFKAKSCKYPLMNSFCKGKFKLFSRTLYIAPGVSHHPFSKLLG